MAFVKKTSWAAVVLLGLWAGQVQASEAGAWEKLGDDDGITVWRKEVEGSPLVAFKGETVVDAPIAKVGNVLVDATREKEWVAHLVEGKVIRETNQLERVKYNHTKTPAVLSDRDFVFSAKAELDKVKKQMMLRLKSVEDPLAPTVEGVVRGQLIDSGYTLTSIEGGKRTLLQVEIHADPKGSVPKWLVNFFQKSWPRQTLEGIRRQAAKPDVSEHPEIKAFFDGI